MSKRRRAFQQRFRNDANPHAASVGTHVSRHNLSSPSDIVESDARGLEGLKAYRLGEI